MQLNGRAGHGKKWPPGVERRHPARRRSAVLRIATVVGVLSFAANAAVAQAPPVQWQPLTLDFAGPQSSELASANPFLDYRLQVEFVGPGGQRYEVPGFFDGDGDGGASGGVWRTRFTPDEPGEWSYRASFRKGNNVAVSLDPNAGNPVGQIDGQAGAFIAQPRDPDAPGFLSTGRLEHVGGHYLKFRDGGYWIKGGTDGPENLLAYTGFDNTPQARHDYASHVNDWNPGDPDWNSPDTPSAHDGRALIGALNYLSSQNVNSVYFLPMNVGGDGQDTWPYVGPIDPAGDASNDNTRFDVSKLRQWETVFDHAQRQGIALHVVLNEAEAPNKRELDDATLGVERKLFYRELIARFGHHNALQWNISEEYNLKLNLGEERVKEFAEYIRELDPYDHPVTVHNSGNGARGLWDPFLGESPFEVTSLQYHRTVDGLGEEVEYFRDASSAEGLPIAVMIDEPEAINNLSAEAVRKRMLWDIMLSGGGVEWYIRGDFRNFDDFRQQEQVWQDTWHARRFVEENLPFWALQPRDDLLSGEAETFGPGQVFARPGDVYAVYLPDAGDTGTLDLTDLSGQAIQRWYNPRTGEFAGEGRVISGGAVVSLGAPPNTANEDWVVLIEALTPTVSGPRPIDSVLVTQSGGEAELAGIAVAGRVYRVEAFRVGQSAGDAAEGFAITSADTLELDDYALRQSNLETSSWTVDLGGFSDANGDEPDFVLLEVGGDDTVGVQAILPGGMFGRPVMLDQWGLTDYTVNDERGFLDGRAVAGLVFALTDLLDAEGRPLSQEATIEGLRFHSPTLDPVLFAALTATGERVAGDFEGDGDVDAFDLAIWQSNFGATSGATYETGDADGDGDVDAFDLAWWQNAFVKGVVAVPAPATMAPLAIGWLVLAGRRGRRGRGPRPGC